MEADSHCRHICSCSKHIRHIPEAAVAEGDKTGASATLAVTGSGTNSVCMTLLQEGVFGAAVADLDFKRTLCMLQSDNLEAMCNAR